MLNYINMGKMVDLCSANWHNGKCRLSKELKGWGCRLLTCLPDEVPVSYQDKAVLFSKVYAYAVNSGVTNCKHFCESDIDKALDNEEELSQMVLLNQPLRADLVAEYIEYERENIHL